MHAKKLYHQAKSSYSYSYDNKTIHLWLRTAKDAFLKASVLYGDPFRYEPIDKEMTIWVWLNETKNVKMEKRLTDLEFDYYFIAIQPPYKRVKYAFLLDNRYLFGTRETYDLKTDLKGDKKYNLFNYFNYPFIHEEDLFTIPKWVNQTVWYQIFPDRFNRSFSYHNQPTHPWFGPQQKVTNQMKLGGNILGIIEKLDYLQDLGCNGIYFTPIFKSPSNHKYDTEDYFQIDPDFGTNEDFKLLVEKAHEKGIKIILDGVFNHCGYEHPFFQDVIKNGKDSIYYDCFYIQNEPLINFELDQNAKPVYNQAIIPNYLTFAFTPFMPKWNTSNPIARKHLLAVAKFWIENFDIDGWRLDVSNEVSHDFWREFRQVVKAAKKEAFIFGENWDYSGPWLLGDQLDAVMNYEFVYPLWQYFAQESHSIPIKANQFRKLINKLLTSYPLQVTEAMFNLVESHDTERVIYRSGENKKLAFLFYLFMFAYPGRPNIYYGGEVGLSGGHDPDSRRAMPWDEKMQDLNFKNSLKWLIKLRKTEKAFGASNFRFIHSSDQTNTIGIMTKKADEKIVVFINPNNKTAQIDYQIEGLNLANNQKIKLQEISLDAYGYLVVKLK